MSVRTIIADSGRITMVKGGKQYTADTTHAKYDAIKERLKTKEYDGIERLFDVGHAVKTWSRGKVAIQHGYVTYDGQPIHGTVVDRILSFIDQGFDHQPMIRFLEKLLQNTSKHSVDSLYNFLEKHQLPIDEDGDFVAYKKVQSNYLDFYRGILDNTPGNVVTMPRREVCDNINVACSYGLHCGSLDYAANQYHPGEGKVVLVKVNPANVVSVPDDCNHAKCRTCEYTVLEDYVGELPLKQSDVASGWTHNTDTDYSYEDFNNDDEDEVYCECGSPADWDGERCGDCNWEEQNENYDEDEDDAGF